MEQHCEQLGDNNINGRDNIIQDMMFITRDSWHNSQDSLGCFLFNAGNLEKLIHFKVQGDTRETDGFKINNTQQLLFKENQLIYY